MRRISIISVITSAWLICPGVKAQDAAMTLSMANEYAASDRYTDAVTMYERVLFFKGDELGVRCYEALGDCYVRMNDLRRAARYYDLAYNSAQIDSVKRQLVFKKASVLIFEDAFNEAFMELFSLNKTMPHRDSMQLFLLQGIAHYRMGDFASAKVDFAAICPKSRPQLIAAINSEIKKAEKIYGRRDFWPGLASALLPGSGQFMSGHVRGGVNALLVNAAFIALFYYVSIEYAFVDALVSVGPWLQRYYAGGIGKAVAFHEENKARKLSHQYRILLDHLSPYAELEVY